LSFDILSYRETAEVYSWVFHSFALLLKNVFFTVGIWKAKTES
jgi:hypothetical protein